MKDKILFSIIFILLLLVLLTACNKQNKTFQVNSFEECANAASYDGGYQVPGGVIPSFCTTPDGRRFYEQIAQEQSGEGMGGGAEINVVVYSSGSEVNSQKIY